MPLWRISLGEYDVPKNALKHLKGTGIKQGKAYLTCQLDKDVELGPFCFSSLATTLFKAFLCMHGLDKPSQTRLLGFSEIRKIANYASEVKLIFLFDKVRMSNFTLRPFAWIELEIGIWVFFMSNFKKNATCSCHFS